MTLQAEIAARFAEMAEMLELLGENRFKVNAYQKAGRALDDYTGDLDAIAHDQDALTKIEGIGKSTAEKIGEFAETGAIAEHEALKEKIPAGLVEMMGVPGLGPKTVKAVWDTLGVTDLDGLRAAIEDGSILSVPRMGEKQAAKIKEAMEFAGQSGKRLALGLARPIAERLVGLVLGVEGVERAEYAGSMRRGRDTIGDIDILAVAEEPGRAHEALRSAEGVKKVLAAGETKTSVLVRTEHDLGRWKGFEPEGEPVIQVDLRTVPAASWGAALLYFTGSKDHNVRMRERAIKKGMTLNEYGLFPEAEGDRDGGPPQKRGVEPAAGATEEEVFAALELVYVPPEAREDAGEFGLGETPRLIEVGDIKAELHAHTTDSDGRMSMKELVSRARDRGFHTIAVTDHSLGQSQARGLDAERLREQRALVEETREVFGDSIRVLAGSEVDIRADGSLDFDDDVLASLDVVVASPHTALDQNAKKATARLIKAIENPFVKVLGHPTGRIINRRKGLEPAMHEVIAAAVEHGVALEINAHWLRLDLRDTHVRAAVEAGCLLAIDCDVHAAEDFDNLVYGVVTGRRGLLTPELCVNAWGAEELWAWLGLSERP